MTRTTLADAVASLALLVHVVPAAAQAAVTCSHRGALDDAYCDEDRDLTADVPRDAARLRSPSTLVFAYTPVEDPALYATQFRPLTEHLTQCTGRRTV
jgi:phosphonate transport system substrate-binding protein